MSMQPDGAPVQPLTDAGKVRRLWLFGGVAALAWWRARAGIGQESPLEDAETRFWQLKLKTPIGAELAMEGFRGRPLLLNFWATWCPPCIEELPLLNRFYTENQSKSWQVLGIAVDQIDAVKAFLSHSPLDFPIAMAGQGGVDLVKSLGNLTGGLPFTVVFGEKGTVLHRKMGRVNPDDLAAWLALQ
jgi:thiol-disulfide isomerase/thioredoxin